LYKKLSIDFEEDGEEHHVNDGVLSLVALVHHSLYTSNFKIDSPCKDKKKRPIPRFLKVHANKKARKVDQLGWQCAIHSIVEVDHPNLLDARRSLEGLLS